MKLPRNVTGSDAVRALERLGFSVTRQVGSHVRMTQGGRSVTVPMHRPIAIGTLQSILRQAGITVEQLVAKL